MEQLHIRAGATPKLTEKTEAKTPKAEALCVCFLGYLDAGGPTYLSVDP